MLLGVRFIIVKHRIEEAPYFVEETANGQMLHVVKINFQGLRAGYGGYMHRANIQMDCDSGFGKMYVSQKRSNWNK